MHQVRGRLDRGTNFVHGQTDTAGHSFQPKPIDREKENPGKTGCRTLVACCTKATQDVVGPWTGVGHGGSHGDFRRTGFDPLDLLNMTLTL